MFYCTSLFSGFYELYSTLQIIFIEAKIALLRVMKEIKKGNRSAILNPLKRQPCIQTGIILDMQCEHRWILIAQVATTIPKTLVCCGLHHFACYRQNKDNVLSEHWSSYLCTVYIMFIHSVPIILESGLYLLPWRTARLLIRVLINEMILFILLDWIVHLFSTMFKGISSE